MRTIARTTSRALTVLLAGTFAVAAVSTAAYAEPGNGHGKGTSKTRSSSGANADCGEYCSTRDGSPSRNGNGGGDAKGRPCAGCVGNADDKNPPGQYPNGSDANNGYECDGNSGIGRTNPAHTGCTTQPAPAPVVAPEPAGTEEPEVTVPDTTGPAVDGSVIVVPPAAPAGASALAEQPAAAVSSGIQTRVLGAQYTRPAAGSVATGQAGLPYTGGATGELLLAAFALIGTGAVVLRATAKA